MDWIYYNAMCCRATWTGSTIMLCVVGLHGLDHPGGGDGDPGAELGQCHTGTYI
jgi:hypothetical protein